MSPVKSGFVFETKAEQSVDGNMKCPAKPYKRYIFGVEQCTKHDEERGCRGIMRKVVSKGTNA